METWDKKIRNHDRTVKRRMRRVEDYEISVGDPEEWNALGFGCYQRRCLLMPDEVVEPGFTDVRGLWDPEQTNGPVKVYTREEINEYIKKN